MGSKSADLRVMGVRPRLPAPNTRVPSAIIAVHDRINPSSWSKRTVEAHTTCADSRAQVRSRCSCDCRVDLYCAGSVLRLLQAESVPLGTSVIGASSPPGTNQRSRFRLFAERDCSADSGSRDSRASNAFAQNCLAPANPAQTTSPLRSEGNVPAACVPRPGLSRG